MVRHLGATGGVLEPRGSFQMSAHFLPCFFLPEVGASTTLGHGVIGFVEILVFTQFEVVIHERVMLYTVGMYTALDS